MQKEYETKLSNSDNATRNLQEKLHGEIETLKTQLENEKVSTKEGKDQESMQSSTTPDPGYQWESNKLTIGHHK